MDSARDVHALTTLVGCMQTRCARCALCKLSLDNLQAAQHSVIMGETTRLYPDAQWVYGRPELGSWTDPNVQYLSTHLLGRHNNTHIKYSDLHHHPGQMCMLSECCFQLDFSALSL